MTIETEGKDQMKIISNRLLKAVPSIILKKFIIIIITVFI